MITNHNPQICPDCGSTKICLRCCTYKKDEDGIDTDKVISGTWFCDNCGQCIGRKNGVTNDIISQSIKS